MICFVFLASTALDKSHLQPLKMFGKLQTGSNVSLIIAIAEWFSESYLMTLLAESQHAQCIVKFWINSWRVSSHLRNMSHLFPNVLRMTKWWYALLSRPSPRIKYICHWTRQNTRLRWCQSKWKHTGGYCLLTLKVLVTTIDTLEHF